MALNGLIAQIKNDGTLQIPSADFDNTGLGALIQDLFGVNALTVTGITDPPPNPTTSGSDQIYPVTSGSVSVMGASRTVVSLTLFAADASAGQVDVALQLSINDLSTAVPQLLQTLQGLIPQNAVNVVFCSAGTDAVPLTNIIEGLSLAVGINGFFDNDNCSIGNDGIFAVAAAVLQLIPGFPAIGAPPVTGYVRFENSGDLMFGTIHAQISAPLAASSFTLLYLSVSSPVFTVAPITSDYGKDGAGNPIQIVTLGYGISTTYQNEITLEAILADNCHIVEFVLDLNGATLFPQGDLTNFYALFPSSSTPQSLLTALGYLGDVLTTIEDYATFGDFSLSVMFSGGAINVLSMSASISLAQPVTLADEFDVQSLTVTWTHAGYGDSIALNAALSLNSLPSLGSFDVYIDSTGMMSGSATAPISINNLLSNITGVSIPDGWGEASVSGLSVVYDIQGNRSTITGILDANLQLFGDANLLQVQNMLFFLQYSGTGWQASFSGIIDFLGQGVEVSAQIGAGTVVSVQLTNHTLGDLLGYMLSFVSSGGFALQAPWSVLNDIQLDDFILTFDITNKKVTFQYDANEDFGFVQINSIAITYDYAVTPAGKAVALALGGNFLGASYPMNNGTSGLAWAPLADSAPAVPGKSALFDLRMLGFGQRLDISGAADMTHVAQAVAAIEKGFTTPPAGGQNLPSSLQFDSNAGWLIGADFTVLNTVSLSVVFDDPQLFGLAIALAGSKAGKFGGLSFEILYKEVSEGVGEYSIWLTLPTAMRHISMGEVNITLPVIGVSVYTNGDFLIDLGYPYNNDYSQSLAVNIFPFLGLGGMYFGLLSSSTAGDLVPDTNNTGEFNPIIEFGFAMNLGVGYDASYGPLSCSVGLTVDGGLIGVLAFFHPYAPNQSSSEFFSLQGTIGIHGWLKGSVNFCIVSASVDIEVDALAGLTYIMYQPIVISFSAEVQATASVSFFFFTAHFSFDLSVSKTFTIGSATPAPWETLPPYTPSSHLFMDLLAGAAAAPQAVTPNNWTWPPGFVYPLPSGFAPKLYVTPIVTAAAGNGTANARIAAALFVENPTPPNLASGTYVSGTDFGVLCQVILAWGLAAYFNQTNWDDLENTGVSAADLECMHAMLTGQIDAAVFTLQGFTVDQAQQILHSLLMQGYIDTNYRVISVPAGLAFPDLAFMTAAGIQSVLTVLTQYSTPVNLFTESDLDSFIGTTFGSTQFTATTAGGNLQTTIFPLHPNLSFTASGATQVLSNQNIDDPSAYATLLQGFFAQCGSPVVNMIPPGGTDSSVAALVFRDYFYLLLTSAVNNARNLIADIPYTVVATDSLSSIATAYGLPSAEPVVEANLEAAGILDTANGWIAVSGYQPAITAGMTLQSLLAAMYAVPQTGQPVSTPLDIAAVANANQSLPNLFQAGQSIVVSNVSFTPEASPTLSGIAAAFAGPAGIIALNGVTPLPDAPLTPLTPLQIAGISFAVSAFPAYNTVNAITQQFGISPANLRLQNPGLPAEDGTVIPGEQQIEIAAVNYIVPPNDIFSITQYFNATSMTPSTVTIGTPMTLTAQYTVQPGDSLFSIADYLGIDIATLAPNIAALTLRPHTALAVPSFARKIAANDTFASLAYGFGLPVSDLASLNADTTPLLNAGAILDIPAQISVTTLVRELDQQTRQSGSAPGTALIARVINRYLMNGLSLPVPGTTLPTTAAQWAALSLDPLYSLTGQQFDVAVPLPASISLTLNGTVAWMTGNPAVTLSTDEMTLVSNAVTQMNSLAPAMPTALTGWKSSPARFAFGVSRTWRAAELQTFAQTVPQQPPLIWPFSNDLAAALQNAAETGLQLTASVGIWSQGQIGAQNPPSGFAFGAMINLPLQPVETVAGSTGAAGSLYSVAIDDALDDQLQAIIEWLSTNGNTVQLSIAYSSGSGLRSDIAGDADRQTINAVTLQSVATAMASLAAPQDFLAVLDNASYLEYQTTATPGGLPAALFANRAQASVTLLVTITSGVTLIPAWCDCLFTTGDIATGSASLMVTAPGLTTDRVTLQAGNIGFITAPITPPDATQPIAQLYQLLGYVQVNSTGTALSVAGAPIPPTQPQGSGDWHYKKAISLIQASPESGFSPSPAADMNPYAQVVNPLQYQHYGFSLVDLFGNQFQPGSFASSLPIPLGYNDPLIGVAGWPNTSIAYDFAGTTSQPVLNLYLNFSPAKYQLSSDQSLQSLLTRLSADLQIVTTVYYQVYQPDVTFALESSIGVVTSPAVTPVQTFVAHVYAFIATLIALNESQSLTQSTAQTQSGDTLAAAAQRTRTNVSALAAMNCNNTAWLPANSPINLPVMYAVQQGDTPQAIVASQSGVTLAALGTLNATAPLIAQTSLVISGTSYTTLPGDTLASIAQGFGAASQSITPGQIVTANPGVLLWYAGTALIAGISAQTVGAGESLYNMLQQAASGSTIQPTLDLLLQANAGSGIQLAEGVAFILPQHIQLNSAGLPAGMSVQTVASASALSSLEATAIDQIDLWYANADRNDILDSAATVTLNGTLNGVAIGATIPITPFDTPQTIYSAGLAAIAGSVQAAQPQSGSAALVLGAITATLTVTPYVSAAQLINQLQVQLSFSDFAVLISTQTLIKAGAVLLAPPQAVTLSGAMELTQPCALTAITTRFVLSRDNTLVNPNLSGAISAQVAQASSAASPHLSDTQPGAPGYAQQNLSLVHFAKNFQSLFPGYLVASPSQQGSAPPQLWAVPLGMGPSGAIDYAIRPETGAYFLNPPLSTSLIGEAGVSVPSYTSGIGLTNDAAVVNFQSIDLDGWARQFLGTFDQIMSPRSLATIYSSSPADFASLLSIRETLVEKIAGTVQPVVASSDPNIQLRQQAAVQAFVQQLDKALLNAYRVDSIVQFVSEVSPVTKTTPYSSLSLNRLANMLDVSLLEFVAANYSCNMLVNSASVTIDTITVTIEMENLNGWFNSLPIDPLLQSDFLDWKNAPVDTSELDQLGATAGILTAPSGGQSIGIGSYSAAETAYGFAISTLTDTTPDLTQIAAALELGGFNPQVFYVAEMLKDVAGLFNGSVIPPDTIGSNLSVTFGPNDTLLGVYTANFQGHEANGQPLSLWDVAIMALSYLTIDRQFSPSTLYFNWQPAFQAYSALSLDAIAQTLGVSLLEVVAANYTCAMLDSGASVTIDGSSVVLGMNNLNAWFNSLTSTSTPPITDFLDWQNTPLDTSELDQLGLATGILTAPAGDQSIGIGSYSTEETPNSFVISQLTGPTPDLIQIANTLELGGFNPQPFYVADMLRDVEGVFSGSVIPANIITGTNPQVTFGTTDSLQSVYNTTFKGQKANNQPLSLWDLAVMAMSCLKIDPAFSSSTLYFDWQPAFPAYSALSMGDVAGTLGVSLLEFTAANYNCSMLNDGASVTIDNIAITVGAASLNAWFSSLPTIVTLPKTDFLDWQDTPVDSSELDQLGSATGILTAPAGGQSIGIGSYSAVETPYGIAISALTNTSPDLIQIANTLELGGFNPQPFYVAEMLKDVEGLFSGSVILANVITGTNPPVTFGASDTLQSVYTANFETQTVNGQPISLWDLAVMAITYLTIDPAFSPSTLYFNWQTPELTISSDTTGLSYIGKPINSAYTIPANPDNTLANMATSFSVETGYLGEVLGNEQGLFNGQPILTITPAATDTLRSIFTRQLAYQDFNDFINAIANDSILAPNEELPLFRQSYGQPLTLAMAAAMLNVDVRTLVWSNYDNAVWDGNTLASEAEFWVSSGSPYPVETMPAIIYMPGLLNNTPALGVLTYPGTGGNLIQPVPAVPTFDNFVTSLTINSATFISTFVGELIQGVPQLFTGELTAVNSQNQSQSYTIQSTDTLVTIAQQFGYTTDQTLAQFVVANQANLTMASGSLVFQWTSLSDVAPPSTIQQIADYFNVSTQEVIGANWNQAGLIEPGVTLHYGSNQITTASSDTLSSIANGLCGSGAYPPQEIFCSLMQVTQNPGLLIPFSQPGILVLQQGVALTAASNDMKSGESYLTFLLGQSGEPQQRVGLNLTYQPHAVKADAVLVGGEGLQLRLIAPPNVPIGSVEVPIPLRSYPGTPILTEQWAIQTQAGSTGQVGEEQPILPIGEADQWTYQFGYIYQGLAQDETQVSLVLNADPATAPSGSGNSNYSSPLFQALAQFIAIMPGLVADLNLLPVAGGASTSPVITNAIGSFITLAQSIGSNWAMGSSAPVSAPQSFNFIVQDLYDAENQQLIITVDTVNGTGPSLPGRYTLPVIQPDSTIWVIPDTLAPPTAGTQAVYTFAPITPPTHGDPDNGKRIVIFDNTLNVLQYFSACGQLNVLRNQDLLYGMATTPAFVYQTPSVMFQQSVKPMIDHATPVAFFPPHRPAANFSDQYTAYLTQMFNEMYGADISTITGTLPQVQIAIGYRLMLTSNGVASLTTLIPLALQARSPVTPAFISTLAGLLSQERTTQQFNGGLFEFDISVYNGDDAQPVLRLRKAQMPLDAQPIQAQRFAAEPDPGQASSATDPDAVNPLVVNASRMTDVTVNTVTRRMLSYGEPVKLKSWFSGMAWADNTTLYYNNAQPWVSRQTPIYADPIIALYVCTLDSATLVSGQTADYIAYFTQDNAQSDTDMSVYVDSGWEAGFHLSMPNPTMSNSAAFNSGTGLHTYNNDALIFNANLSGYAAGSGDDWLAASTTTPFSATPTFSDFTTSEVLPDAAFQSGLCQYAVWRDTLSISPVAMTGGTPVLAFSPAAAKLADQGAFHARFVMENETPGAPNQLLSMTVTQGSPMTQFIAAGIDGARIAGIFNPVLEANSKASLTPGGIYPSLPGTISGLTSVGSGGATVQYLIVYQQVNLFHCEQIPEMGNPRMNWVGFAVFWNPTEAVVQIDPADLVLTLLFNQPQVDNFFVVAGLPNQMANQFDPGQDNYDSATADAWAQQIGATAFNYVTNTQVTYGVGKDRAGNPVAANQVYTNYLYTFEQAGPVSAQNQTVILLQPHQYLDPFNTAGTVLNPGDLQPLFSGAAPGLESYWIARGRLAQMLGADFSIIYQYPNFLPSLPIFSSSATRTPAYIENGVTPASYSLLEMAAAMIGNYWVADFTNSTGNTQNAPATTGMANTGNMQDTYNAAKHFYLAAKMLPMLFEMTSSGYFNSQTVMDHINGATIYNGGTSYYAVGANIQNGQPAYFTPGGALHDFVAHLIEAFDYYFGGTPMSNVSRSLDAGTGQVLGKSFYYSYYDANNHHVFLYPAAGAGGIWPTNRDFETATPVFDGYGTVSMLNDHAYTYGYLISAVSLLSMVLKNNLSELNYTNIDGLTGQMGESVPVAQSAEYIAWQNWLAGVTPVIDALVIDLAYDAAIDTGNAQGVQKLPNQTFPAMEFLDQWTGISWTDGFLQSPSVDGHNANSPWEEMLAWVGIIQWGYATGRAKLVDHGIYLYTTALYSLEYYNYNVTQNYLPTSITADTSANGDFIPRAMNDFASGFSFYSNPLDPSGTYNPLTFAIQPFQGRAMTETTLADSQQGTLDPALYALSGTNDHRTSHVTYFYQGNVRSDNTYWNSPVGMLSSSIYPHGAFSLPLSRHPGYMSDWLNAIHFQNQRSYYQLSYPTTINLLSALLGMTVSLEGDDVSNGYASQANPTGTIIPIPCAGNNYAYSPNIGENSSNPQRNAFLYLTVNDGLKPYDWYWSKASGINQQQNDADKGTAPWQSADTGETLAMYVPDDTTEAEILLQFYSYDTYGSADFSRCVSAVWADSTQKGTPMLPMGAVWSKPLIDMSTQWTYIVYNPNTLDIKVTFADGNGGTSQTKTVSANQMFSWTESSP